MIDERERYERAFRQFQMTEPAWEILVDRRDRKRRNQRIAAGVRDRGLRRGGVGTRIRVGQDTTTPRRSAHGESGKEVPGGCRRHGLRLRDCLLRHGFGRQAPGQPISCTERRCRLRIGSGVESESFDGGSPTTKSPGSRLSPHPVRRPGARVPWHVRPLHVRFPRHPIRSHRTGAVQRQRFELFGCSSNRRNGADP